jgi:hypothetical protein
MCDGPGLTATRTVECRDARHGVVGGHVVGLIKV